MACIGFPYTAFLTTLLPKVTVPIHFEQEKTAGACYLKSNSQLRTSFFSIFFFFDVCVYVYDMHAGTCVDTCMFLHVWGTHICEHSIALPLYL